VELRREYTSGRGIKLKDDKDRHSIILAAAIITQRVGVTNNEGFDDKAVRENFAKAYKAVKLALGGIDAEEQAAERRRNAGNRP
jgi:hypothetical protein